MIAPFFASLLLLPAPPPQAESHPAGADAYLELPDVMALRAEWKSTGLGQMLHDEEILGTAAALMDRETLDPFAALDEQLPGNGREARALLSRVTAASFSVHAATDEERQLTPQDIAVLGLLDFASAEDAATALAFVREQLDDVEELELLEDEAGGLAFLPSEDLQRVSFSVADRRMRVRYGDPTRLSFAPEETASTSLSTRMGELPERSGTVALRGFSNLAGFARAQMDLPLDATGQAFLFDALEAAFGPPVSAVVRGGAWRMVVREGQWYTDGRVPTDASLDSPFGAAPIGEGRLARLHPEAVLAWVTRARPGWAEDVLNMAFQGEGEQALADIEAKHGLRLDTELKKSLGEVLAVSVPPMRSLMSLPAVFAEVDVLDAEAVKGVLTVLGAVWSEESGGTSKESAYRGTPIFTFQTQSTGAPAGPIPGMGGARSLSFVVFADHLLITTSQSAAKREVRRRLGLGDDSEPPPLLADLTVPEDAVELSAANWMTFLGRLYDTLRGLGPMFEQMSGEELPFDPETLPESAVFTRFFGPTLRYERAIEGARQYYESSSIGPEPLLAIVPSLWVMGSFGGPRPPQDVVFEVPAGDGEEK